MHDESPASTRREFVGKFGRAGAAAMAAFASLDAFGQQANTTADFATPENLAGSGEIPRRKFGKTGEVVSALGLGGHTFALAKSPDESIRIVREAIDNGITFLDNAWEYHDGRSEELMGKALAGGWRDKVFLMTKLCTHGRDKKVAMQQLEESLQRLGTDHLDLWQIHEVVYDNDPDLHFAPDGAIEALVEARQQGKVRYIGFTGHKHPDIHLKMLSHDFAFDSVQMPINGFDAKFRSFQQRVLPILLQRGIAPIGMKSLNGNARAVEEGVIKPEDAIRYSMSLPISVLVSGMDSLEVLRKNIAIARNFKPMTVEERIAYEGICSSYALDGRFELYKTSILYDGPPGREQHGFPAKGKVEA